MERIKSIKTFVMYFLAYYFVPSLIFILINFVGIKGNTSIMEFLCSLIFSIILFFIIRKPLKEDFKKLKGKLSTNMGLIFKWWGIGLAIMIVSNSIINFLIFDGSIAANEESVRALISQNKFLSGILIIFLAPFTEEITFRFALRKVFKNPWCFSISSGLIFGLLHVLTPGVTLLDFLYIIPYGALGFAFANLYFKTDNIWTNIIAHALHNAFTFTLIVLFV